MKLCQYHTKGIPQGTQPGDFYVPGCPACEKKLEIGKTTKDAPVVLGRLENRGKGLKIKTGLPKTVEVKTPASKLAAVFVEIPVVGFPGVKL